MQCLCLTKVGSRSKTDPLSHVAHRVFTFCDSSSLRFHLPQKKIASSSELQGGDMIAFVSESTHLVVTVFINFTFLNTSVQTVLIPSPAPHQLCSLTNAANMLGNLTPYRSMSVNKGFYISKERA